MTICTKIYLEECPHHASEIGVNILDRYSEVVVNLSEGICPECLIKMHREEDTAHCPCCDYLWSIKSYSASEES